MSSGDLMKFDTDKAFQLLMARFDTLESQNAAQLLFMQNEHNSFLKSLADHSVADALVHKVVERHSTYFSVLLLGIPVIGSVLAGKLFGWKPL